MDRVEPKGPEQTRGNTNLPEEIRGQPKGPEQTRGNTNLTEEKGGQSKGPEQTRRDPNRPERSRTDPRETEKTRTHPTESEGTRPDPNPPKRTRTNPNPPDPTRENRPRTLRGDSRYWGALAAGIVRGRGFLSIGSHEGSGGGGPKSLPKLWDPPLPPQTRPILRSFPLRPPGGRRAPPS